MSGKMIGQAKTQMQSRRGLPEPSSLLGIRNCCGSELRTPTKCKGEEHQSTGCEGLAISPLFAAFNRKLVVAGCQPICEEPFFARSETRCRSSLWPSVAVNENHNDGGICGARLMLFFTFPPKRLHKQFRCCMAGMLLALVN